MRRLLLVVLLLSLTVVPVLLTSTSFAYDPLSLACETDTGKIQSPNCPTQPTTNPLTGKDGILLKVAKVIALIAGFAALLVIIISGISYITADGDAQKAKKARGALVGALIGLAIIAVAGTIITFVIKNSGA